MITSKELINLIRQGEGQFVEFKDARVKPSALAKALVAFANTNA
jgi:predicted HTH transcriptional regulator